MFRSKVYGVSKEGRTEWDILCLNDRVTQLSRQLEIARERERALLEYLNLSIEVDPEKLVVRKRGESGGE